MKVAVTKQSVNDSIDLCDENIYEVIESYEEKMYNKALHRAYDLLANTLSLIDKLEQLTSISRRHWSTNQRKRIKEAGLEIARYMEISDS